MVLREELTNVCWTEDLGPSRIELILLLVTIFILMMSCRTDFICYWRIKVSH